MEECFLLWAGRKKGFVMIAFNFVGISVKMSTYSSNTFPDHKATHGPVSSVAYNSMRKQVSKREIKQHTHSFLASAQHHNLFLVCRRNKFWSWKYKSACDLQQPGSLWTWYTMVTCVSTACGHITTKLHAQASLASESLQLQSCGNQTSGPEYLVIHHGFP